MAALLLALSLLGEPSREEALMAAQAKRDALQATADKAQMQDAVKSKKETVAAMKRVKINPAVPGLTTMMVPDGKGGFVQGETEFPDARSKQQYVDKALAELASAEIDFKLWQDGALKVSAPLPELVGEKLSVGQVGRLPLVRILSHDRTSATSLARFTSSRGGGQFLPNPVIIDNFQILRPLADDVVSFKETFWVSGKKTVGKQTLFVIEPLP
jgi:hypothetical protein